MLGVFEGSIEKQPAELLCPSVVRPQRIQTKADIARHYTSRRSKAETTIFRFSNGNFMAFSQKAGKPSQPRSTVVMDEIYCIFLGSLVNISYLQQFYGLSNGANEAMVVYAAYKTLRDQRRFTPDYVARGLVGSYAFMLFDSKFSTIFLARDREGGVEFHWGTAADGSLVCCDNEKMAYAICGKCYIPFPPGCFFLGGYGLINFDHPYFKVRGIEHHDHHGIATAIVFQVDFCSLLYTHHRIGGGDNQAAAQSYSRNDNNEEL